MKPNIIHIGYHKTGTNWFQRLYYPSIRNYTYIDRKKVREAFLNPSAFKFSPDAAFQSLKTGSPSGLILCEEELSGNIHSGGFSGLFPKEMAYRLRSTLPNSCVVIFIRNQSEMISSVYNQYIREGGTYSVVRYLFPERYYFSKSGFRPAKIQLFSFEHFEYYPLIKHYESLFGREKLYVFLYEEFNRDLHSFLKNYQEIFEFEVDHSQLSFNKINTSYNMTLLNIAKLFNHFTAKNILYKQYYFSFAFAIRYIGKVIKFLNRHNIFGYPPDPDSLLGEDTVQYIQDRYRNSNKILAEKYNLPLKEYGYPL